MMAQATRKLDQLAAARLMLEPERFGHVVSCDSGLIEVSGLACPIGTICRIQADDDGAQYSAEVIGFRSGLSVMMLLGDTVMLSPGALVSAATLAGQVAVGGALLGRAVDGSGRPIDGGERPLCRDYWPLGGKREDALERASVIEPFDCGVRAINALVTMGVGQRMGILAGSGVGKSVLIDMIASGSDADIKVIALIGERAREVSDFVRRHMHGDHAASTIVVAVPADHAPNLRLRGAQYACAIAEYFRERGKRVLLVLDSLTRVAHAAREIGLLLGEPGAARGYPPSALALITKLVERAGNSARSGGAITGIYSVLADGDNQNDPVVDTARAIFDGHIVLSRDLAEQGHFPAIDIPASLSRVMNDLVTPQHRHAAMTMRAWLSAYQQNRDLVLMGAYRQGADAVLDEAMARKAGLDTFLRQTPDTHYPIDHSIAALLDHTADTADD